MFSFLVLVALARIQKSGGISLIQEGQGGCGKAEWTPDVWVALDWRGYEHAGEQPANLTESDQFHKRKLQTHKECFMGRVLTLNKPNSY